MLRDLRTNYQKSELTEESINSDPFRQLEEWLKSAIDEKNQEPTAMVLSTVDARGFPDSRVVLLKEINSDGLVFFTNYNSKKGRQITASPNVAVNFFWSKMERQVRIKGVAEQIPEEYSVDYFKSRPIDSQLGAWASPQSRIIENRKFLEENFSLYQHYFQDHEIIKPPHWGGFLIRPEYFEFWQGRSNRLHDRIAFQKSNGAWDIFRLAP
ncbi:pyridoxamine 5'-phosphate oxidase [Aquipluma nitroreducens]|uniref:Pyridoxine/pyridoxamine 5'-phosphate oxidase n=1 Tax=Aquipluma nitroreducens TaxID=2010828 RepID=A0A5K7S352_9BACT|nr:pyridoxamine 5'-phosphate oxidase [Aquipluma nitroreducens]BBE15909.1 pyridoxamine 5'-phosphate oxidase [Aquipluma nitroreducens]